MVRSYGKVSVTTGGIPVRLTANLEDPTLPVPLQKVRIQPLPANNAVIYVFAGGANFSGDHRTDLEGCIGIIAAPVSATDGPFAPLEIGVEVVPLGLYLNDLWIDGTSGEGVVVAGIGT
jgi:hypothetical protein